MSPPSVATRGWQFWIDRGGTFTDVVALRPDGTLATMKLLSENPRHYRDAALAAIRRFLQLSPDAAIPPALVESVRMGTTVATNALLERQGEPTVLVVTRGFADVPRIGTQDRPRLFDRRIVLPALLHARVIEADERVRADGTVERALDEAGLEERLREAWHEGFRAVAIAFVHGYRHPEHELRAAAVAERIGMRKVSLSHRMTALMKFVGRADTAVADAYLTPILRRYVDDVARELGGVRLMFMQSNGGLVDAQLFQGRDAVLSGPAGGIVGMARSAEACGVTHAIGFDMGGTSTDVAHYAGEFERTLESIVAGVRLRAPMMQIHTVAAGGGSILDFDGARMRVGPRSSGAHPGPACYRNGGPLSVTDCNVLLGKLQPRYFPTVFGPAGDEPLDLDAVRAGFDALAARISGTTGTVRSPEDVAEGFLDIAVANMANAIKRISVQRGHDVSRYTLVCFGGAAGQHACLVADALGITRVLVHPLAGVLSAFGMGLADITATRERTVERTLDDDGIAAAALALEALADEARDRVLAQGVPAAAVTVLRRLQVRYGGTDGDDAAETVAEVENWTAT